MPTYTNRLKIPIYGEGDGPPDLPAAWTARSAILDTLVPTDSGPLGSRPVSTSGSPGVNGRHYIVTDQPDSPRLDVDTGTGWFTAGPAQVDAAPSIASLRTLGTGAQQAAAGNDARFLASGVTSGDISGTLPGPLTVATWGGQTKGAVVAGSPPQAHGNNHNYPGGSDPISIGGLTDSNVAAANKDGTATTPSLRTLGTGSQQAAPGADSRFNHSELQAGVLASGDAAVSAVSVAGASGAITFTVAAAPLFWMKNVSGVLVPGTLSAGTTTLSLPAAPASARYAVYGLETDATGALSLVKGADTATALNTGTLVASNTPATTAGKLRIWDFAVFNNAGAFSLTAQIDRRPWARGAFYSVGVTCTPVSVASPGQNCININPRIECSGAPLEVTFGLALLSLGSAPLYDAYFGVGIDLVFQGSSASVSCTNATTQNQLESLFLNQTVIPTPGSHRISIMNYTDAPGAAVNNGSGATQILTIKEQLRVNANNGTS